MTMAASTSAACRGYTSSVHAHVVVNGFQRLREEGLMCDTKLVVQGETFNVHRSFLASCSDYFFMLFTDDFQESRKSELELKGITARGLKALLDYAYTGSVLVTRENLQDVLEAAAYLQFTEILHFCAQYISDELTIENCLQFLKLADLYSLKECKHDTKSFILENFIPVAQSDDFRDLSLETFCDFLADDRLTAPSELEVFHVALKWLTKHPERECVAKDVLGHIRYGLMTGEQVEEVYTNPLMMNEACCDILQSAISYHIKLFQQPIMQTKIANMRAYQDSLLISGAGYEENILCNNFIAAKLNSDGVVSNFETLHSVRDKRYFAAVAVLNNFLYVVGGQTAMAGDGSHATNTVFRYNPRDERWLQLSSMKTPRTHFALISLNDCLISVGGKNNRLTLSSAERYDIAKNEWTIVAQLPHSLFSHAGCSHKGLVYVSGGCPGEDFTDEMHCYDIARDGWQLKCPMNQSRGYHVMVSNGSRIFACAGNTNAGNRRDVLITESYDPELDQWTILSSCLHGQSEAPSVVFGNKLYILGGYSWDINNFQDIIQKYNMDTDTWELESRRLPDRMTGVVACALQLPQLMYDQSIAQSGVHTG